MDTQDHTTLLTEIRTRIQVTQYAAPRAVNKELVGPYWSIGRLIVVRQQIGGRGKAVVQQLVTDPQASSPGTGGFSTSNLWRIKSLFEAYRDAIKFVPLVREIG